MTNKVMINGQEYERLEDVEGGFKVKDSGGKVMTYKPPKPQAPKETPSLMDHSVGLASQVNNLVPDVLGAPSDLAAWIQSSIHGKDIKADYGSDYFKNLTGIGTIKKAETYPERAGEFIKYGLGFGAGTGTVAASKSGGLLNNVRNSLPSWLGGASTAGTQGVAASNTAARSGSALTNIKNTIINPYLNSPRSAAAIDAGVSTLAGVGSKFGEDVSPNHPQLGSAVGALAAPLSPLAVVKGVQQFSPVAKVAKSSLDWLTKELAAGTQKGGTIRAENRVQSLIEDSQAALRNLRYGDTLKEAPLSPAKKSGDKHLLAQEKLVRSKDPALELKGNQDTARVNQIAREEAEKLSSGGKITKTQEGIANNIARTKAGLEEDLRVSLANAEAKASELKPNTPRSVSSQLVEEEVSASLLRARAKETKAWNEIPETLKAPVDSTISNYRIMLSKRSRTSPENDIPPYVREFLGEFKNGKFVAGALSKNSTVTEINTFRSELGQMAAKHRANGEYNQARILKNISDDLLEDVSKVARKEVKYAVGVSRALNETYTKGEVGKLLGFGKDGGAKTSPELFLEKGVGTGIKGALGSEAIIKAGGNPQNIEQHLLAKIENSTVIKDGVVNPRAADKFIRSNEELLAQFPQVRRALEEGIAASESLASTRSSAKAEATALDKSLQGKFSTAKPKNAMNTILDDPNPIKAMRSLYAEADDVGREGLASDAIKWIMKNSLEKGTEDAAGFAVHNAKKMRNLYEANKQLLSIPVNKDKMRRLNTIINTLEKNQVDSLPNVGSSVSGQKASKILDTIFTFIGTKAGIVGGKAVGVGGAGSLKSAQTGSKRFQEALESFTQGRVTQILTDAVDDPKLLEALLTKNTATLPRQEKAQKAIIGWLAGATEESD